MMQISVWEFDQARALHRLLKKKLLNARSLFASRAGLSIDLIFMSDSCLFGLKYDQNYQFIHFQNMFLTSKGNERGQRTVNSQSSFLFSFEFMSHPFF